jgi:hypothetical protein
MAGRQPTRWGNKSRSAHFLSMLLAAAAVLCFNLRRNLSAAPELPVKLVLIYVIYCALMVIISVARTNALATREQQFRLDGTISQVLAPMKSEMKHKMKKGCRETSTNGHLRVKELAPMSTCGAIFSLSH